MQLLESIRINLSMPEDYKQLAWAYMSPQNFWGGGVTLLWWMWTSGYEKSKLRCSIKCGDIPAGRSILISCWAGSWTSSVFWLNSSVHLKSLEGCTLFRDLRANFRDLRQVPTGPFTKFLVQVQSLWNGKCSMLRWLAYCVWTCLWWATAEPQRTRLIKNSPPDDWILAFQEIGTQTHKCQYLCRGSCCNIEILTRGCCFTPSLIKIQQKTDEPVWVEQWPLRETAACSGNSRTETPGTYWTKPWSLELSYFCH